jgi:calcium-dependent protein kinase
VVKQVLLGLAYIHGQKIVHRDIKPENLMFESEQPDSFIKIIDFGLGDSFDTSPLNIICGTALYVAPEVLKRKYNERCDIWSLGAVLFRMLTGQNLIAGVRENEMFQKLYALKEVDLSPLKNVVSETGYEAIKQMLTVDYDTRPSAAELLDHAWFDEAPDAADPKQEQEMARAVKNLRNFSRSNYLHNIIYFYTTSCIVHNEEKQTLSKIFLDLDTDCDGRLSLTDLVIAFQNSGRSFARSYQLAERIFRELQIEANEGIDFKGFLSVCCSKQSLKNEEALKKAFSVWDSDGKGAIDIETIKAVLRNGCFAENPEIGRIGELLIQREFGPRTEIGFDEFKNIMNRFAEDEQMSQSIT